jgi:hypothetical protein
MRNQEPRPPGSFLLSGCSQPRADTSQMGYPSRLPGQPPPLPAVRGFTRHNGDLQAGRASQGKEILCLWDYLSVPRSLISYNH